MKDWQIRFEVNGLVAPKDGITFDNEILFKKKPGDFVSDDNSLIFFKISYEKELTWEKTIEIRNELGNLLQTYALFTGNHVKLPRQTSWQPITNEEPFGYFPPHLIDKSIPSTAIKLNEEQIERYTSQLKNTVNIYQKLNTVFKVKSKYFLRNAILYYYNAVEDLEELRLEEALIDLITSLEFLFSRDKMELSYRLSLRSALLLSKVLNESMLLIHNKIKDMYNERSKIVHGVGKVKLSYDDLWICRKYVRVAILLILHMKMNKNIILNLLDKTILNDLNCKKEIEKKFIKLEKN